MGLVIQTPPMAAVLLPRKIMAKGNTTKVIMEICFLLGAVHLTVAHVITFFRLFPSLKAFAEIGDYFDEPVRTYSTGMRSRLAFGLSLAFDFDVMGSDPKLFLIFM